MLEARHSYCVEASFEPAPSATAPTTQPKPSTTSSPPATTTKPSNGINTRMSPLQYLISLLDSNILTRCLKSPPYAGGDRRQLQCFLLCQIRRHLSIHCQSKRHHSCPVCGVEPVSRGFMRRTLGRRICLRLHHWRRPSDDHSQSRERREHASTNSRRHDLRLQQVLFCSEGTGLRHHRCFVLHLDRAVCAMEPCS